MSYEMPVVVRLSKEDFALASGRPVDDPNVQRIGNLTVVLQAIDQPAAPSVAPHSTGPAAVATHPTVAQTPGAADALKALEKLLKPVEETLFQRLRSNPALGKRFVLNPLATLEELGLIDASVKDQVQAHAQTLSSLFPTKK